ncbi:MAG: AAA family ATPase [Deltaproteobacteria bacterium]|nr:AAA family ATPase [Deltaproteobacteria bacterium]MBL7204717.1 AAA family ATPase [Desulfobacteraceae bacterium]
MGDKTIRVKINTKEPILEALVQIIKSSEGFEIQDSADERRPDLFILELGRMADKQFELIQSLLYKHAVGEFFLTSANTDQALLRGAMKVGVKEFFAQPINEDEVRQALEDFRERTRKSVSEAPEKSGMIIDVIGSKGGVGTTTLAVNLAVSLAQRKSAQSVALVDMNVLFGEVIAFLDISPIYHWGEISKNIDRLDATFLMSIMTEHSSGVHVLTAPGYLDSQERATPEIIRRLLGLMRNMYDLVVIDGGQSLDDSSLTILEMSDYLFIVSILNLPSLSNMAKLLKLFHSLGYPMERIKIVANRYLNKSEISLSDAEAGIETKFFWIIPDDYKTAMDAINRGKAFLQVAPNAAITKSFKDMVNALVPDEKAPQTKQKRFFRWW